MSAIDRLLAALPSGRAPSEQPNVAADGAVALSRRFWLLAAAVGVAAGLGGDAMMLLLHGVQHLAFPYHPGDDFQSAVERASPLRRAVALLGAGAFAGPAWWLLRRHTRGAELDNSLWSGTGELPLPRSIGTSVFSEVVVGAGASLGREAAPKQLGAAAASLFARWARLSPQQRRLLVACGGGAGMAAVYNVPLGGALITAEILYGSLSLPVVLPALVTSWLATATAWLYLPVHATYPDVPPYRLQTALIVWALIVGPLIGVVATLFVRVIGLVSAYRPGGRLLLAAPLLAFGLLAAAAVGYPQLLGNGKDMALRAFIGQGSLGLLLALAVLKPVVTALCLGSGATGGLFTPTMSTGAVLGAFLGLGFSHLWPGAPLGAYALIGATAMVGAGMQAPLAGLVLVLELTRTSDRLMVPMIAATALATLVARLLGGYSIYSARLPAHPGARAEPD